MIEKFKNKIDLINIMLKACVFMCIALIFISYLLPLVYSWIESTNFIFVNAWDEETYLSYQGALALLTTPGYWFSSLIIVLLQNIGLSGAEINLLFDVVLGIGGYLLVVYLLTAFGAGLLMSTIYATIFFFGSVLFNLSNPIISIFFSREYGWAGHGFEAYQSYLRTPQPQLSIFFIVVCGVLYIKTKRFLWLLIPLPFLYFYVGVVYAYLLILFMILKFLFLRCKLNLTKFFIVSVFSFLLVSIGLMVFDLLFFSKFEAIQNTSHYIETRIPVFPLILIMQVVFIVIQSGIRKYRADDKKQLFLMYLTIIFSLSVFFLANLHVLAGFKLSYKNYYDYGINFLGAISIIVFLESVVVFHKRSGLILSVFFLISIALLSLKSYGFDFESWRFKIYRGLQYNDSDIYEKIFDNPTRALFEDSYVASKIAYSMPKTLGPTNSNLYSFPFIANDCSKLEKAYNDTIKFLDSHDGTETYLKSYLVRIEQFRQIKKFLNVKVENSTYCDQEWDAKTPFFLVPSDYKDDYGWLIINIF